MIRIDMDKPITCAYCPFCNVLEVKDDEENHISNEYECCITNEKIPNEVLDNYKLFEECPIEEDMLL